MADLAGQRASSSAGRTPARCGGPVGAAADRDLDAVLALFDAAARYADRLPGADVAAFVEYLADQQLPGRHPRRARARGATRWRCSPRTPPAGASGGSSPCPGVQEGAWPDLRLRGSLLGNERLVDVVAGVAEPAAAPCRGSRRCWPRNAGCSTSRAPARGDTLLVSAVQARATNSPPASSTSSTRPGRRARPHGPLRAPARPGAGARGAGGRAAPGRVQPGRAGRISGRPSVACSPPAPGGRPAGPPGPRRGARRGAGRLVRPRAAVHGRPAACARRGRARLAVRRREDPAGARCAGCSSGTAAARSARCRRSPARSCTHWSRPVRRGRTAPSWRVRCSAAWTRLDLGAPWFGRRELARVRAMLAAFDGWVRRSRADGLRLVAVEHPVQLDLPTRATRRPGRPGPAAARPGRPARGRRRGPPRRGRRQDRPHGRHGPGRRRAPAARGLPARGRARCVHRAGRRRRGPGRRPAGLPRRPVGVRRGQGARAAPVGRLPSWSDGGGLSGLRRRNGGCAVPRTVGPTAIGARFGRVVRSNESGRSVTNG